MHSSLYLLLRLRRWAYWRRTLGALKTARGAVMLLAAAAFFSLMILPQFVFPLLNVASPEVAEAQRHLVETNIPVIRTLAPLVLLIFVLWSVGSSFGDAAIYFTPAEVDLLFAGPFSRRELLLYKLSQSIRGNVFSGTLFSLFIARHAPLLAGAWLGAVLTLLFYNALTLTLTLLTQVVSQRAYSRLRQLAVAIVIGLAGLGLAAMLKDFDRQHVIESLGRFRESLAGSILLAPLEVFPRIVTARTAGELALWTAVASTMIVGLYALAIGLDANYLEAAQIVSQRFYERLQRRRQTGGGALSALPIHGAHRLRIPPLPWLWGAGPNMWRQWLLLTRRSQGLILLLVMVVVMGFVLSKAVGLPGEKSRYIIPVVILGALAYQSLLASIQLPAGFRGDLDRMDWLKSLPIHPTAVVCGQVAGPALALSLAQGVIVVVAWAYLGGVGAIYLSGLVLLAPVNLYCFAIENLVFLLFPMRMSSATAGDFQLMGRFMLLKMFNMLLLVVGLAIAAAGAIVYFLIPQVWLAVGCCLVLLLLLNSLIVYCASAAFVRFDISQDTPPE